MTRTIRVPEELHARANQLASELKVTAGDALWQLVLGAGAVEKDNPVLSDMRQTESRFPFDETGASGIRASNRGASRAAGSPSHTSRTGFEDSDGDGPDRAGVDSSPETTDRSGTVSGAASTGPSDGALLTRLRNGGRRAQWIADRMESSLERDRTEEELDG